MTKQEMNLAVFAGEETPHVFFQPRIEPWYAWHKQFGKLPLQYSDMSLLELYDELNLSMRYVHYYTGIPNPVRTRYTERVSIREEYGEEEGTRVISTPYGELVRELKKTVDKTWRTVVFPVRTQRDLKKLRWLYENTSYSFSREKFERGSEFMGDRGEPQFWVPKSPYQALCQAWMKLPDLIYALMDAPEDVEETMAAIDNSYDPLYEQMTSYGKLKIVNFGENLHADLLTPQSVEQYLIPFYEKRSNQLRQAGIYTHIHIDGYFKRLLEYFKDLPFDGLEALTPLPQGDASIEEMKEHIGDKVLLDGIPAVLFLPSYPREQLEECVKKVVKLFHPRLVLGISDELPQGVDETGIERVTWVSDYCRERTCK